MRTKVYLAILLIAALLLAALPIGTVKAASLVEVTNFGTNPTGLRMYLYVPDSVAARPALLLALHYCTGTGPAFYSGTEFASLADRYGFIVIYPSATRSGSCWDVSSPQTLQHNGGSDPTGLISMVNYVKQNYNADPNRVYVTGASSGAMMTNVLLGDYPDVFKAGAAFMGVPFACFATTDGSSWNSACANGQISRTPQQWGDLVRNAYPGYSGARPRMQIWHGTTDSTLNYNNFGEQIKQWTNVLGVSQTPAFTDQPRSGWTRTRYGATGVGAPVEAISIQGTGHSLPLSGQAAMAIQFFGLDTTTPPTNVPPTNVPPTNIPPTTVPGGNLLTNGDMEAGTANWSVNGSGTLAANTSVFHGGARSLLITGRTAAWNGIRQNVTSQLVSGRSYTSSVWVRSQSGSPSAKATLALTANGSTSYLSLTPASAVNSSGWTLVSGTATVSWSGTLSSAYFYVETNSGTDSFYIDDASFSSGTVPPTNVPPTNIPPTNVPPTNVPPTNIPPTTIPPTSGPGACSPVTSTISVPFTFDGAGTFCWQTSNLGSYVNSWNLESLTINGVSFTNRWVGSGSYPPAINGYWYISYRGNYAWSHIEVR